MINLETRNKILSIAISHLGEKETDKNQGPIVEWSVMQWTKRKPGTGSNPGWASWCAGFVSTCYKESGIDMVKYLNAPYEALSCDALWSACKKSGKVFRLSNNDMPLAADLIFFGVVNDLHHVGLVERIDNDKVFTIEGNASNQVMRREYFITASKICGYGTLIR